MVPMPKGEPLGEGPERSSEEMAFNPSANEGEALALLGDRRMSARIDDLLASNEHPSWGSIRQYEKDREATNERNKGSFRVERDSATSNVLMVYQKLPDGSEVPRKFTIKVAEGPEDPVVLKAYELMLKMFDPEELDPLESMKNMMEGLRHAHDIGTNVKVVVIEDEKGDVVTMLNGAMAPLHDQSGAETGNGAFLVGYVATDDDWKKCGFGREIMITGYQVMQEEARKRGLDWKAAAGECTWTSGQYWSRLGWKKPCTTDAEGKVREVEYTQCPLDFDLETGAVGEDAGEAPEHLMLHWFDQGNPPTKEVVASVCRAFGDVDSRVSIEAFKDAHGGDAEKAAAAHAQHLAAIEPHEQRFTEQLQLGDLGLFSLADLQKLQDAGKHTPYYACEEEEVAVKEKRAKALDGQNL